MARVESELHTLFQPLSSRDSLFSSLFANFMQELVNHLLWNCQIMKTQALTAISMQSTIFMQLMQSPGISSPFGRLLKYPKERLHSWTKFSFVSASQTEFSTSLTRLRFLRGSLRKSFLDNCFSILSHHQPKRMKHR
jgi:hypothetical protein